MRWRHFFFVCLLREWRHKRAFRHEFVSINYQKPKNWWNKDSVTVTVTVTVTVPWPWSWSRYFLVSKRRHSRGSFMTQIMCDDENHAWKVDTILSILRVIHLLFARYVTQNCHRNTSLLGHSLIEIIHVRRRVHVTDSMMHQSAV